MELMGVVGIIVNCALIGQSGIIHRMFPNITGTQTIILIIVLEVSTYSFEVGGGRGGNQFIPLLSTHTLAFRHPLFQHMMLALKMGISYAIPDTPAWVEKEMAKIEYRRRELEKASQSQVKHIST